MYTLCPRCNQRLYAYSNERARHAASHAAEDAAAETIVADPQWVHTNTVEQYNLKLVKARPNFRFAA